MNRSPGTSPTDRFAWLGFSLPVLVIVGLAVGAGSYEYQSQKKVVRERTLQSLQHLVFYKTLRVKDWYFECMRSAKSVSDSHVLKQLLARADTRSGETQNLIRDVLSDEARSRGFIAWGLLDGEDSLLSWSSGGDGTPLPHKPLPEGTVRSAEPAMTTLHEGKGNTFHLDIMVPLSHPPRKDAPWTAFFVVDPWPTLFAVMAFSPADIPSLETSLVQRQGQYAEYLTPLGKGTSTKPPLSFREPLHEGSPAYLALVGQIQAGEGRDYRGRSVLYATNYIPWVTWGVLATIEEKDAFSALRFNALLAAGVALFAVLAAVAFLYAWWNRRHRLVSSRFAETLSEHKDTLQKTVHKLITAREEERKRISLQLHDGLAQSIGCARMFMSTLEAAVMDSKDPRTLDHFKRAEKSLEVAETECRAIISRYRPPELDRLGLSLALQALGSDLAPAEVTFTIPEASGLNGLSQNVSLSIFQITQEALLNAKKHSRASNVLVTLHFDGDDLDLTIEDNGQGFEMSGDPPPLHFGLVGLQEIAGQLDGTLEIKSQPGKGTKIHARIPVPGRGGIAALSRKG